MSDVTAPSAPVAAAVKTGYRIPWISLAPWLYTIALFGIWEPGCQPQGNSHPHPAAPSRGPRRCPSGGGPPPRLRPPLQLREKITRAIEFQSSVQRSREDMVEKAQGQVYAAERDVAGRRKYAERKQQAIDHRAMRQDQKSTDEMALTVHLRQTRLHAQGVRS